VSDTNYSDGEIIQLKRRVAELEGCLDVALGRVRLSRRELEVARQLIDGRSAKETAACLGLSYKTIDSYKASLFRKLRIHDVVRLTHCANRLGIW
jgi:DNA-binding CsgD family transcriptional regulator